MTDRHLPPPWDATGEYLAAIYDRLGDILDRLPAPPTAERADGTVELTEPKRPPAKGKGGGGGRRAPAGATGTRSASRRKPTSTTNDE